MTRSGKGKKGWHPRPDRTRSNQVWKTIPLSEITDHGPRPPEPQEEIGSGEASSALIENLERLDSVVHDFIATLDMMNHHRMVEPESENVARFMQILTSGRSTSGPVLGPPVICGMSPPINLESVFGFLGSLRKTGILRVRADDANFRVSVVRGDVVHGVTDRRPEEELLGNILVARQAVDFYELDRFFTRCGPSAVKIGEALNRQELVSTKDLREALEIQLQHLFDRLLSARAAEWCFHEGEVTLSYVNLRVNATRVLLESARKRDEDKAP